LTLQHQCAVSVNKILNAATNPLSHYLHVKLDIFGKTKTVFHNVHRITITITDNMQAIRPVYHVLITAKDAVLTVQIAQSAKRVSI
jgi:hypothetical protein